MVKHGKSNGYNGRGDSGERGEAHILEGPVNSAKEFGCYPGNDGKHFKFWRNVVRFRYAPFTEGKWRCKGEGRNREEIFMQSNP